MIEEDLDKVLNYMKQYVENVYEHDSEPMLNWKDLKLVLEEIERLNNIINGMEKFFQYAYDNEVRPLNDRKISVWTICLDKLQELKGSDEE